MISLLKYYCSCEQIFCQHKLKKYIPVLIKFYSNINYIWNDQMQLNLKPDANRRNIELTMLKQITEHNKGHNLSNKWTNYKFQNISGKVDYAVKGDSKLEKLEYIEINTGNDCKKLSMQMSFNNALLDLRKDGMKKEYNKKIDNTIELLLKFDVSPSLFNNMSSFEKIKFIKKNSLSLERELSFLKEIGLSFCAETFNANYAKEIFETKISVLRILLKLKVLEDQYISDIFQKFGAPEKVMLNLPNVVDCGNMNFGNFWSLLVVKLIAWKQDMDESIVMSKMSKVLYILGTPQSLERYHTILCLLNTINFKIFVNKWEERQKILLMDPLKVQYIFDSLNSLDDKACRDLIISCLRLKPVLINYSLEYMLQHYELLRFCNVNMIDLNMTELLLICKLLLKKHSIPKLSQRIKELMKLTSLTDLRLTPNNIHLLSSAELNPEYVEKVKRTGLFTYPRLTDRYQRMLHFEVRGFLRHILNIHETSVFNSVKLLKIENPPNCEEVKRTFIFLLQNGIPFSSFQTSYQILLFPFDIVIDCFSELQSCPYAQEFRHNSQDSKLMQLLLYSTSKKYNVISGYY